MPARLVLATGNAGKLREMREILAPWSVEVCSLAQFTDESAEETGLSFVENALLKARFAAAAAGLAAIADDSGLEVDALDGAPGVRSARWAPTDPARIAALLAALDGVPAARRTARFRCAVVVGWPDGRTAAAEGACEGRILDVADGAAGFGYDPVFWSADLGKSFGVASEAEKRRVSHRARAVRALGAALRAP